MPYNMREDKERNSMSLVIHREWNYGEGEITKWFTLEQLLEMQEVLRLDDEGRPNGDGFTEFITGLSCDSYADTACDIMEDMYRDCSQYDDDNKLEGCYNRCMREYEFLTCYTVYRLWNSTLTEEVALRYWKESCICTLEDIIESKGLDEE